MTYFIYAFYWLLGLATIIGITIILTIKLTPKVPTPKNKQINPIETKNKISYLTGKYIASSLLTKTEYCFYTILKKKCDENNLLICPKVRLEDFIHVIARETLKYRGYIKSRHVDFLICEPSLKIFCAIELDDPSHNTAKAKETDKFKNELFDVINIPLYRIKTGSDYTYAIEKIIESYKEKRNAFSKNKLINEDSTTKEDEQIK